MNSTLALLHDPANGPLRGGLIRTSTADFHSLPDGVFCPRCNRPSNVHVWQAVADGVPEQGGVIDCGIRP